AVVTWNRKLASENCIRKSGAVNVIVRPGSGKSIVAPWRLSTCSLVIVSRKAMVLAIRSFNWGKVVSVSGIDGASTPASRAAPPLAASLASCTWRVNGCMSGSSRASVYVDRSARPGHASVHAPGAAGRRRGAVDARYRDHLSPVERADRQDHCLPRHDHQAAGGQSPRRDDRFAAARTDDDVHRSGLPDAVLTGQLSVPRDDRLCAAAQPG